MNFSGDLYLGDAPLSVLVLNVEHPSTKDLNVIINNIITRKIKSKDMSKQELKIIPQDGMVHSHQNLRLLGMC